MAISARPRKSSVAGAGEYDATAAGRALPRHACHYFAGGRARCLTRRIYRRRRRRRQRQPSPSCAAAQRRRFGSARHFTAIFHLRHENGQALPVLFFA